MPRGDRTGPYGEGPMTGRGLGYCAGGNAPGYQRGPQGRRFGYWGGGFGRGPGRGFGWGGGMGFRRGFGWGGMRARGGPGWGWGPVEVEPPLAPESTIGAELEHFRNEIKAMKADLDDLLDQLESRRSRKGKQAKDE